MGSKAILSDFGKTKKRFFEIKDGEKRRVKYLYVEEVDNPFKAGKMIIRYHFEINGKEMLWDRESKQLAAQMIAVPEETMITIKRTGEKSDTRYEVRQID